MDPTTIIRGPAMLKQGANVFWTEGDIKLSLEYDPFDVSNSLYGVVDKRAKQRKAVIQFTPAGVPSIAYWPYANKKPGDGLIAGTNAGTLEVHAANGEYWQFFNCPVTKMPPLILSTTKIIAGEVEFTAIGKNGVVWSTADSLSQFAATGANIPTTFDPAAIITQKYVAVWGAKAAPWNAIKTVAGWTMEIDLNLDEVESDEGGIEDWTVGDTKLSLKAQLIGITSAQAYAQYTPDVARGGSILGMAADMVISGTGVALTAKNVYFQKVPVQFGLKTLRFPEFEFMGCKKVVTGVLQPMFTLAFS